MPKVPVGRLFGNRIVVWDIEAGRRLFKNGYYGKPLGIPKPKDFEFDAPLILDLIEGYYLARKKKLKIQSEEGEDISLERVQKICTDSYTNFTEKFVVYSHLRDSGLVVAPGIKFGSDFAVYEHGPGIDHAPYLVQVAGPGSPITATSLVRSGRLATTVRKQFIIAVADVKDKHVEFLAFDWWRA